MKLGAAEDLCEPLATPEKKGNAAATALGCATLDAALETICKSFEVERSTTRGGVKPKVEDSRPLSDSAIADAFVTTEDGNVDDGPKDAGRTKEEILEDDTDEEEEMVDDTNLGDVNEYCAIETIDAYVADVAVEDITRGAPEVGVEEDMAEEKAVAVGKL